jgi:hypothetical protein
MKKAGAGCPPPFLVPLSPFPLSNIRLPHFRLPLWTEEKTISRRGTEPLRNLSASPRLRASFRLLLEGGKQVQDSRDVRRLAFESRPENGRSGRESYSLPKN